MGTTEEVAAALEKLGRAQDRVVRERDLLRRAIISMQQILKVLTEDLARLAVEGERNGQS